MFKLAKLIFPFLLLHIFLTVCTPVFAQDESDEEYETVEVDDEETDGDTSLFDLSKPSEIDTRKVPEEKVNELKKDDAFWYANTEIEKEKRAKAVHFGSGLILSAGLKH